MASCWIISGLVIIAVAFIACAVSLVAPYWFHMDPGLNFGLWAFCNSQQKCTWFYEDEFKWEKARPGWWQASQGLFGGGVVLLLIAFLTACIYLCSACCKTVLAIIQVVNGLLVFAFIALGVGLALFGAKANEEESVTYDQSTAKYFDWGYWCGCGGTLLVLLAILMYTCEGCRRNPHEGYVRGQVV